MSRGGVGTHLRFLFKFLILERVVGSTVYSKLIIYFNFISRATSGGSAVKVILCLSDKT